MKKNHIRLLLLFVLAALVAFAMIACDKKPGNEETTIGEPEATVEATEAPTDPETEVPTEEVTTEEVTTEEVTTLRDLVWETYDPALDHSAVDQNAAHAVDQSQWIAQDGLDRVVSTNTRTG